MPAVFPAGTSVLATLRSLAARGDIYAEGLLAILNNTFWPSMTAGVETSNVIRMTGQVKDQDGSTVAKVKLVKVKAEMALLAAKTEVALATAAVLPNVPVASGTGVGKTLTANANVALTIDGVAVLVGQRVLVQNEVTGANNGIYTQTQLGTGSVPWILTRATDSDTALKNIALTPVYCRNGVANCGKTFVLTNTVATIETTALVFKDAAILITMALGAAGATITGGSGTRELWVTTAATGTFSIDVTSDAAYVGPVLLTAVTDNGETELNTITFA